MDVRLPDGRILRGVPEGTTKAQIAAKLQGLQQSPASEPQESYGRTAFDQGMQGATFGFADEVSDALGAVGAGTLSPDLTIPEAWQMARDLTRERQERQITQNPKTAIAANIAGGLLTGGAAGTTKAGAAVGNSLRTGNLGARVAKGAAAGAASGGVYGAGSGQGRERLERAGSGALYGAAFGGALPAAGAGLRKLNTKKTYPTFEKVRNTAHKSYEQARQLGANFKPDATDDFIRQAAREIPSDQFAKDVIGSDEVSDFVSRLTQKGGEPMTLETFEQLDKHLGDLAHRNFINAPDISRKYNNLQNALRDIVENPSNVSGSSDGLSAFREGTRLWSVSAKMRDVERVLEDAQYYQVPATAIKTGFRRIARDAKKLRGYTPQEIKAIQTAAKTGRTEGLLATFGSKLIPIAAGAVGGPKGAAIGYGAATVSRAGSEGLKSAEAAKVSRLLAERSGLVKTAPRLDFKAIMKLPPKQAQEILRQMAVQGTRHQSTK